MAFTSASLSSRIYEKADGIDEERGGMRSDLDNFGGPIEGGIMKWCVVSFRSGIHVGSSFD